MYDRNKLIVTATLGDLEDLLANVLTRVSAHTESETVDVIDKQDTVVKGIEGICQALGVGKTKANEIKQTGMLDDAIDTISARLFYVHVEKARDLYLQKKIV